MKKLKEYSEEMWEFSAKHPIFFIPPSLAAISIIGMMVCEYGDTLHGIMSLLLNIIGILIVLFALFICVSFLWITGKSILEDEKNKNDKN